MLRALLARYPSQPSVLHGFLLGSSTLALPSRAQRKNKMGAEDSTSTVPALHTVGQDSNMNYIKNYIRSRVPREASIEHRARNKPLALLGMA